MPHGSTVLAWRIAFMFPLAVVLTLQTPTSAQIRRVSRANSDYDGLDDFLRDSERHSRDFRPRTRSGTSFDIESVDIQSLHQEIRSLAESASRLAEILGHDDAADEHLRDVFTLRAHSSLLERDSRSIRSATEIMPAIKGIDRLWRVLKHKLDDEFALGRVARETVARLDAQLARVEKRVNLQPQIDRRELIGQSAALAVALRHLVNDVELELRQSPRTRQLLLDARKVQGQAQHISSVILDRADRDQIVVEYQRFDRLWAALALALQRTGNPYLERSVRRVGAIDAAMHELLWLTQPVDHALLLSQTRSLMKDVDEFFSRTSMRLVLGVSDLDNALDVADEFYGVCQHFEDCVEERYVGGDLVDSLAYVQDADMQFQHAFHSLRSTEAQRVLQKISDDVVALRTSIGRSNGNGSRKATQDAAALQNLAEHLQYDVRDWLKRSRESFSDAAQRETNQFLAGTRRLYGLLVNDAPASDLRNESAALYGKWTHLYNNYLQKCNTQDREHISRLAVQTTRKLVDIRASLAQ